MRSAIFIGALAGLAAATPLMRRQDIEFDQFDDQEAASLELTTPPVSPAADPGSYDAAAAVADAAANPITADPTTSKVKRTAKCPAEPAGYGPKTTPDTASDFLANPTYDSIAQGAAVPDGYSLSFSDLQAAAQAPSYITYKTMKIYDPIQCQQFCDATTACWAFNVYIERDPSVTPNDTTCPNPPSTVNYKCSLFGAHIEDCVATNAGQYRSQFQVVITGSNGYNKLAPPCAQTNFTGPTELAGAIQSPDASYIGYKYYAGPYDPSQCAASCQATTAYDKRHPRSDGTYDTCAFFNSYVLSKNGIPQGTYCSMYTKVWGKQYSTNVGQYRGSDYYSVSQSYSYTLNQ